MQRSRAGSCNLTRLVPTYYMKILSRQAQRLGAASLAFSLSPLIKRMPERSVSYSRSTLFAAQTPGDCTFPNGMEIHFRRKTEVFT